MIKEDNFLFGEKIILVDIVFQGFLSRDQY